MASEDFYSSVVFPEKNQQPKSRIPPVRKDNVIYAEVKLKKRPGQPVEETDSDTDAEEIRTDDAQYTNYMMIDWNPVEDVKQPCGETPVVPPANQKKKINLLTPLLMFHCALLLAAFISLTVYYVISHKYTEKEQKLQHNLSTAENKSMLLQADLNIMQVKLSDLQNQASALNWSCNELRFLNRDLKQNQSELQNKTKEMRENQTELLFENAKLKSNQSEQQEQNKELKDNQSQLTKNLTALLAEYRQLNDSHSKLTTVFNKYCPVKKKASQERKCDICPDQWFNFKSKCYFFTTEARNWNSSREYCSSLGAKLVIIESKEEQTFIIDKIKILKKHEDTDKSYWIGLTDEKKEGEYQWVDNSPLDQSKAQHFWALREHDKGKEPDNWTGKNPKGEDCVTIQVYKASHDPVDNTTYEDIVEAKNVTPKEKDVYYSLAAAVPRENEKRKRFLVKLFLLLLYILLFDTITFLTIYYVTDLKEKGHIEKLNGKYAAFHKQLDNFKKELLSMSEENDYLQGNLSEIQYQYKEMSKNLNEMTKINAILNRFCPGSDMLTQGKRCTVCPEGWLLFNLKCYFFSADTMSWSSSRDMCNSIGGRLVIIRSKEEQEFLLKTMSNKEAADKSYWIGLTDQVTEGQFIWVDGTPVAQHEGWDELWGIRTDGRREPDNWVDASSVTGEHCVHIYKNGGYQGWYDAACQQKYKRICEAPAALVLTSPVSETQSGV